MLLHLLVSEDCIAGDYREGELAGNRRHLPALKYFGIFMVSSITDNNSVGTRDEYESLFWIGLLSTVFVPPFLKSFQCGKFLGNCTSNLNQ